MKTLLSFTSAVLGASLAFAMSATTADARPSSALERVLSRTEQVIHADGECFTKIRTIRHRVGYSTITIESVGETFCK